jgi:hypothetical protein
MSKTKLTSLLVAALLGTAIIPTALAADSLFTEDARPLAIHQDQTGQVKVTHAELLATTNPTKEPTTVSLIRRHSDGKLYFMVNDKTSEKNAFVPYSSKLYNFPLVKDSDGDYPPLMFVLSIPNDGDTLDKDLGEWHGKVHHIPVYALFTVVYGTVVCQSPYFSATYLNPSHYHDRIKEAEHARMIDGLMKQMPALHKAVKNANITLPD